MQETNTLARRSEATLARMATLSERSKALDKMCTILNHKKSNVFASSLLSRLLVSITLPLLLAAILLGLGLSRRLHNSAMRLLIIRVIFS